MSLHSEFNVFSKMFLFKDVYNYDLNKLCEKFDM